MNLRHSRKGGEFINQLSDYWLLKKGYTKVYQKVYGLAAWNENCKWYSSLPLDAVVSLFCGLV
jgi:hypothetical protein